MPNTRKRSNKSTNKSNSKSKSKSKSKSNSKSNSKSKSTNKRKNSNGKITNQFNLNTTLGSKDLKKVFKGFEKMYNSNTEVAIDQEDEKIIRNMIQKINGRFEKQINVNEFMRYLSKIVPAENVSGGTTDLVPFSKPMPRANRQMLMGTTMILISLLMLYLIYNDLEMYWEKHSLGDRVSEYSATAAGMPCGVNASFVDFLLKIFKGMTNCSLSGSVNSTVAFMVEMQKNIMGDVIQAAKIEAIESCGPASQNIQSWIFAAAKSVISPGSEFACIKSATSHALKQSVLDIDRVLGQTTDKLQTSANLIDWCVRLAGMGMSSLVYGIRNKTHKIENNTQLQISK